MNTFFSHHSFIIDSLLFFVAVGLFIYLLNKLQTINVLKNNLNHLTRTIQDLEHQAKLIIKSDMELKLYQEEEEDKLDKLTFLKNLILSSISILDREDLFSQINEKTINDLGFRKGVILNFNDLGVKVNVNFEPGELEKIRNFFLHKKQMLTTIPLLAYETETGKEITTLFQSKEFLIALIRAKEIHAIFLLFVKKNTANNNAIAERANKNV